MPNPLARISAAAGRALSGLRTTSVRRAEGAKFARMSWPAWGSDPAGWWGGGWNTFGSWMFGTLPGGEWNYAADAGDLWLNSCVSACLAFVADNITQPELQVVGPDGKPAKGHPLVALMADPNPDYDADSLWYAVVLSYYVAGNAYLVKARAKNPSKFYLYNLPFWEVYPVGDPSGGRLIDHYIHRVGGRETRIERRDMVHVRHGQDPGNPRIGIAPLLPVLREIATDNTATIYGASVLRNMGIPGVIVQSADPQTAQFDAKARRGLESEWQEKTTGENRGRPIVSSFPLKIDTLDNSPERMALDSLRKYPEARICAAFKLPPQVVGMTVGEEVKTYSNYDTADRLAWRNCLVPLGRRLAHALTQQSLVPDFKGRPGLDRVHWDYSKVPAMAEDQDAKAKRYNSMLVSGGIMRSEYRAAMGLPTTENDEVYHLPKNTVVTTGDNFPVATPPDVTPIDDEDPAGGPDNEPLSAAPDAESADVAEAEKDDGKGGKDGGKEPGAKSLPAPGDAPDAPEGDDRRPFPTADELAAGRDKVHALIAEYGARFRADAERLRDDLDDSEPEAKALAANAAARVGSWLAGMKAGLNKLLTAAAVALGGDRAADTKSLQTAIAKQEAFADNFAQDILSGKQAPDGTLASRAEMYAESAWATSELTLRELASADGLTRERSVLDPFASHCGSCVGEADRGWVEIGELIPPGERQCRSRCRCTLEYR